LLGLGKGRSFFNVPGIVWASMMGMASRSGDVTPAFRNMDSTLEKPLASAAQATCARFQSRAT
jgi:hypothetical protein